MSTFLRITGMGLFAIAGVAVAICIATSQPDASPESASLPLSSVEGAAKFTPHPLNLFPRVIATHARLASHVAAVPRAEGNRGIPDSAKSIPAHHAYNSAAVHPSGIRVAQAPATNDLPLPARLPPIPGAEGDAAALINQLTDMAKAANQAATPANPEGAAEDQTPSGEQYDSLPAPSASDGLAGPSSETAPSPSDHPNAAVPGGNRPVTIIKRVPGEGDDRLSLTIPGEDLTKVLQLLSTQGNLNILASKSVQGTVSASLNNVDIETALDAILKSTGFIWWRDGKFIHVGSIQDRLMMQQAGDKIATRLYRPNYVKASDLQTLVTPLLTSGIGTISVTTPAQIGIAPDGNSAGGDAFAGQEALLVRDYANVLAEIDQIVEQVDRRPTQVAIEAMILSVNLNDKNELGVDFEALRDKSHIRVASGNPLGSLAQMDFSSGGLKVGFLDSNLALFLHALESIGDTNVIATPRLMCMNKHRAEILIGEQLGYVSTTQTETSTTQSVEFLEVGTQLRIRPFISSDGMVRMEVHPELSTGNVRIESNFTLPDKRVTQVTTNIMVRDGCTVIIGGLLRDELTTTATQIPLFGSLPVIGPVFRNNSEVVGRQEILVLITPRIVYEPEACCQGDRAASEFHHRQSVYADQMIPFGKRYLGRKYFRLAQMAWDSGNARQALRLINLAIHFDPLNRAAIDLRADIWNGAQVGDHTLPPSQGGPVLDGENLPPWLLQRLDSGPNSVDHPLDPGRPGHIHEIIRPGIFTSNPHGTPPPAAPAEESPPATLPPQAAQPKSVTPY